MTTDSRHEAGGATRSRRPDQHWLGASLAVGGAVLLFLGWWGASGAATVAEQLPYIASGSIPGAALVVAGAVLIARESSQRAARRADDLIAQLHALLVEEVPAELAAPTAANAPTGVVALMSSEHYHRADCALVAGKPGVERVGVDVIDQRHLSACQVCEPDRPAA